MRILIADDHPIFRRGLRRVLEDFGHEVVAECVNGDAVAGCVARLRPDLVLIDLQMPGRSGVETLRTLDPSIPAVVLTVSDDRSDLEAALEAGARGYLLKSTEPRVLVHNLEAVRDGYRVAPGGLRGHEAAEAPAAAPEPRMSGRQRQVLMRLTRGMTLGEIADDLGISVHTVRTYQDRLMEKFGVASRAELIYAASGLGQPARSRNGGPMED